MVDILLLPFYCLFCYLLYRIGREEGRSHGYAEGYRQRGLHDTPVERMTMDQCLDLNNRIVNRATVIMDQQERDQLERMWEES